MQFSGYSQETLKTLFMKRFNLVIIMGSPSLTSTQLFKQLSLDMSRLPQAVGFDYHCKHCSTDLFCGQTLIKPKLNSGTLLRFHKKNSNNS